jgi:methionine synthase I (cobalamin-dependent)/5,10-methylenetetrahydrofolate reductase
MTKTELLERLKDSVLLFDGAMGTMLYAKGIFINQCFDELNLSRPDLVKEIHREYVNAGADCIETNTFGANSFKLGKHGFNDRVEAINTAGARLAREIAGDNILVAGSMGPLGIQLEPWGPTSFQEARNAFKQQARALADGGVDLFILETFLDLSEIRQGLLAIKEVCDLPVITSMTIGDDGKSLFGTEPQTFTRQLDQWGSDVIGLNCSVGPQMMMETLEKIFKVTSKPIMIMPNAGIPKMVEGRNFYLASGEYMAEYARRFIQAGAKIVGGCCGTTPQYIRSMRNAIRSIIPQKKQTVTRISREIQEKIPPVPMKNKSKLGEKISRRHFVTTVEIVPPRGSDPTRVLNSVKLLKDNRVDAVNIPDGPRARSRMSAPFIGILIENRIGMETILHYTCRDRNLLGMMSDMIGLNAVGIKNLLIITGDPPKMGDFPDASAVFDVDSIGLTNMVNHLNQGIDLGGNSIGKPTGYLIGVGVNPGAIDMEREIRRFEWKVKAGAEYAITQPIFDLSRFRDFLEKINHVRIPILAGIWPLISLRNAEFMNNEVPGASVPGEIMERLQKADRKNQALEEGMEIAREMILSVRDLVQGIQVSAPFGKVSHALEVLSVLDKQS